MKATHQVDHSSFVQFGQPDRICVKRLLRLALLAQLWMIYCIGGSAALAQSTYGTILGTVSDQRGGVLAAAKITLKDRGTSVERTGVSNESGDYGFVNIGPGAYDLTIELNGFQKAHFE